MKCPKCKMEIPDGAEICPYCRSRLSWDFSEGPDGLFKSVKKGFQEGSSNSGCMVILPLVVVTAYSLYYLISAC